MQQQNKRVSKIADIGELNKRIQLMKMMDTGKSIPILAKIFGKTVFLQKYGLKFLPCMAKNITLPFP
ncbi:hypothetical protein L2520_06145 [Limosilactobacillus vaginalis]|uniref:Transposase n=1 Tax=Limosilactobacillus vaginalis TaxID=1633 RepID=A0ABT4K7Q2_9LACO|nr:MULTISPECIES: hypothetical protein [Limosilactobacillus]MCZ3746993.1 hypothetical protein [Limosilactobacillus vaginalis]MCZ3752015.1 hypothetical protein [Limosilactobacillus vaginalis]MCZ3753662.1 hypothetical protein [Limosilactobacillus vaginalis]MCZ3755401.1 hypothetical protein [Limosilactobacillus vaginalis]MCZ3757096.1 hypothetical protein [Limosilactobacillus vaginalis]